MTLLEKTLKYFIYSGIVLILFTPLIVPYSTFYNIWTGSYLPNTNELFNLFFPYITGKAYFFRILAEIVFFLWLSLAVLNKEYRPKKSILLYSLIAFMVSIFVSNYIGANWTASFWSNFERMDGYITLLHLFALFLAAGAVLRTEKDWKILFNISIFISFILSYVSLKQISNEETDQLIRVDSTLGNPIYLAIYMLLHVFIILFYLLKKNYKQIIWWVYILVAIFDTYILFQTGTRGAVLGLVGGIMLSIILIVITNFQVKFVRNIALGILVFVTLSLGTIVLVKDSNFIKNNPVLNRAVDISFTSGTGQARLLNWQTAITAFRERPIFGWGQSNYNLAFDKYYLSAMHGNEAWFDRTHNIVLDWLISGGILGLLFLVAIMLATIYLLWRKTPEFTNTDRSVLTGLLAAYFIHNLFVFDNIVSYIIIFLIFAFVYSQSSEDIKIFTGDVSREIKYFAITILIILLPVCIYIVNYQSYTANRELANAMNVIKRVSSPAGDTFTYYYEDKGLNRNFELYEAAISRNTFGNAEIRQQMMTTTDTILKIQDKNSEEIKQKFISTVIIELEKQISEFPADSRYPYLLGVYYARIGDLINAEKWLLESIKLSPNKQTIRIPLIRIYLQSGQKEKALALAEETYYLDKSKDELWIEYAKTAFITSQELLTKLIDAAVAENDTEKVIALLQYNIEKQPENVQNVVSLSAFYHKIGMDIDAISVLDSAIAKFPAFKYQLLKIKQDIEVGKIK